MCSATVRISVALRATSPIVSRVGASAMAPAVETRPRVGFQALTPQAWAGMRSEPPVSDPSAATTDPLATAAAEPDETVAIAATNAPDVQVIFLQRWGTPSDTWN